MKIRKAVIPVAGYGTRFLPFTKAIPKEMIPIVDKPVIQHIVEEAVASGIEEIILITGQNKRAIEDHFDYYFELEYKLQKAGKSKDYEAIRKISDMAKFIYVRQKEPLGNGHAILCAKEVVGNEPFVVAWGDELYLKPGKPRIRQLIDVFEKYHQPVLTLIRAPKDKFEEFCRRYGCVEPKKVAGRVWEIKSIIEKPEPKEAPSDLFSMGGYVFNPDIFEILEGTKPGKGGEIWLVDAIHTLTKQSKLLGLEVGNHYFDIGSKGGFLQATVTMGLEREDTREEFQKFLKKIQLDK